MSTISPPAPRVRRRASARHQAARANSTLGRYTDRHGHQREVLCRPGPRGSVLVIDRLAATHTDVRLLAHLAADEPAENARIVASLYLADERRPCCRSLNPQDLRDPSPAASQTPDLAPRDDTAQTDQPPLIDPQGRLYQLETVRTSMSLPQLRWRRHAPDARDTPTESVSVREVIAGLESYEPVRTITARALADHAADAYVSVAVLRAELARVHTSPVVLNRGLREAVLAVIARDHTSLSEIAIRCGRVKRDRCGNEAGETSWLARRIGQLPEGGQTTPTPWIHSDTLALIARQGLGIAPREVELG